MEKHAETYTSPKISTHRDIDIGFCVMQGCNPKDLIDNFTPPPQVQEVGKQDTLTERRYVFASGNNGRVGHVDVVFPHPKEGYVRDKQTHGRPPYDNITDKCERQIHFSDAEAAMEAAIKQALANKGADLKHKVLSPMVSKERYAKIFEIDNSTSSPVKVMLAADRFTIQDKPGSNGNYGQPAKNREVIELKLPGVNLEETNPPYDILMWVYQLLLVYLPQDSIKPKVSSNAGWIKQYMRKSGMVLPRWF